MTANTNPSPEDVLLNIKAEIARANLNQTRLAPDLGISAPTLSEILTGKAHLSLIRLLQIADILDLPVSVFFETRDSRLPAASLQPGGVPSSWPDG